MRRLTLPLLCILLAFILAFSAALLGWGTRWALATAEKSPYAYRLVTYWDGSRFPSGRLQKPIGIASGPDGSLYVTDARARVVHLSSQGEWLGEWGDPAGTSRRFGNPVGVAVAADGSVFVSDYGLDRIHKFTPQGAFVLTFGESGDGPGQFDAPAGMAADLRSVYVADFYNHRLQEFDLQGNAKRVIGHPGRLGEGGLHYPTDVALTPEGLLVVADAYNYQLHWFRAGEGPQGRVGYHLLWLWPRPATGRLGFNVPSGVAIGPEGLIHVADSGNHRVVLLSPKGEFVNEWSIPQADPMIYSPEHVAVSPDGRRVYATDLAGDRIIVLEVTLQSAAKP